MKFLFDVLKGALLAALTLAIAFLIALRQAHGAEAEYFVGTYHTSDLFRGCPFRCDVDEAQQDYLTPLGVTITAGKRKRWEIDLSHGLKWIDRGEREPGSEFGVRYYPLRGRKS